ncbi:uncharacterized protein EI90DRAFT_3063915 [Cantharellus anzutake]|uniref:uncharacterized protein n=1 Tax=Cantharellus anzutake TaxID=1750568 RepID=UPI001906F5CB|nr:uncharacterized protein EI90DRAFT_3063915 [Cantharellus anzutake]KAF8328893.1 hypothetical protein EI90DRAFT_3063915 [Cantharellus anzutake]
MITNHIQRSGVPNFFLMNSGAPQALDIALSFSLTLSVRMYGTSPHPKLCTCHTYHIFPKAFHIKAVFLTDISC